jgi:hypothetical protein
VIAAQRGAQHLEQPLVRGARGWPALGGCQLLSSASFRTAAALAPAHVRDLRTRDAWVVSR